MTERPDLYAILGVPASATQTEISHAYRALLRRYHPDTRPSEDQSPAVASDATLQQVLAAYTVLRDPARRADYDHEVTTRADHTLRRPQQPRDHYGEDGRPPIVAGPVRWHHAP